VLCCGGEASGGDRLRWALQVPLLLLPCPCLSKGKANRSSDAQSWVGIVRTPPALMERESPLLPALIFPRSNLGELAFAAAAAVFPNYFP